MKLRPLYLGLLAAGLGILPALAGLELFNERPSSAVFLAVIARVMVAGAAEIREMVLFEGATQEFKDNLSP